MCIWCKLAQDSLGRATMCRPCWRRNYRNRPKKK